MPNKTDVYKSPITALVERAEVLGWDCEIDNDDSSIEFRQASPAGEDFSFYAYGNTVEEIIESIRESANDFDMDEHIKMWLDAKEHGTGGVPSVSELVEDAKAIQEMLNTLAWDDELCGNRRAKIGDGFTLRKKIEETKAEYLRDYGALDWRYIDEGLPWAIQDYHGSKGSVMDFTEDDWLACKENGWTLDEVCNLCDEERFSSGVMRLTEFLETMPDDMPKEDAIAAVEDFYTWRNTLLPIVEKVYG